MSDKMPNVENDSVDKSAYKRKSIERRFYDRKERRHSFNRGFSPFKTAFLLLLGIAVIGVLLGKPIVTFSSFLEFLQTCPEIPLDWLDWSALDLGDWGIFNVFRNFIMMNISLVNFLAFIATALLNFVTMVLWFFKWVFL